MRILLLSVLFCLAFQFTGHGQSLEQVLSAGDESFQNRDYYNAYRCYETILDFASRGAYKGDSLEVKYKYAQAAQRLNDFAKAQKLYDELSRETRKADKDYHARSVFYLAKMLQNLAVDSTSLYGLALDNYQFFISEGLYRNIAGEPKIQERFEQEARAGMASCAEMRSAPIVRTDSLYRLPKPINSKYSELGPVRMGDTLYYASIRFLPKGVSLTRQPSFYTKQLMATFDENTDPATGLDSITSTHILPETEIYNAEKQHTLHTAFSQDGQLMFFSSCIQEEESITCSVYRRRRLANGAWSTPEKLSINSPELEYTTTQPSTAFDCMTGREWLYFSSDRPGTRGGLDIWRAEILDNGALGAPENLSAINTDWNEATPFFHSLSQRLYFSSDAPPGFGEYDIFYCDFRDNGWSEIRNMGLPYNSGYNDQYFFLTPDGKQEYFTSDRPRSFRFVEELEFCCTDIYTMGNKVDRNLEVLVEDCDPSHQLEKTVEVYDLSCGESQLAAPPQVVTGKGTATFSLKLHHKYEVSVRDTTSGVSATQTFDLSEEQYVFNSDTIRWSPEPFYPKWVDMTVVAYDESTGDPIDVSISLKTEAEVEVQNRGGNIFRVEPGAKYRLQVQAENPLELSGPETRQGSYQPLDTTILPVLSSAEGLRQLCGKKTLKVPMRVQAPSLPLPIVLYFDHDMPKRYRGRADQTRQTFDDAITQYIKNEGEFKRNNAPSEERRVKAFFEREVKGGLSTLENLAESLLAYVEYMGPDEKLVIEIQGYCSPRGRSFYNRLLSKRRIQCVRSFLESYAYKGKVLRDYIGTKFIIREMPLGESRASSKYPDNDPNSIWGIGPALDRRVEIVDLSKGNELTGSPAPSGSQE